MKPCHQCYCRADGGPARTSQAAETKLLLSWFVVCLEASLFPCVAHCQSHPLSRCCKCVRKLCCSHLYLGLYRVLAESLSCLCGPFHNTELFFSHPSKSRDCWHNNQWSCTWRIVGEPRRWKERKQIMANWHVFPSVLLLHFKQETVQHYSRTLVS